MEGHHAPEALTALLTEKGFTGVRLTEALPDAKHVFTHRIWEMRLWAVHIPEIPPALEKDFYTLSQLDSLPIPTAMRAARAYVQKELTE